MSWKRGLTRIFVVFWIVWGLGLGTYAVSDVLGVWDEATHRGVMRASGAVYRFPSKATDQQITAFLESPGEWEPPSARVVPGQEPTTVTAQQLAAALKSGHPRRSVLGNLGVNAWEPLARDERANAPWRYTLKMLGLWFGLGGLLVPGVLLVTIRWVWAGFEHRPEAKI
jgi:hypothetical protein